MFAFWTSVWNLPKLHRNNCKNW